MEGFLIIFCLLIRLLVVRGKHQERLLYSWHFLLRHLCFHILKSFLLLTYRRQEPWTNPWVVFASRGKWAYSQWGISLTNMCYPKIRDWYQSHCWVLHSGKRGWAPQQADHVRKIPFDQILGAVRAGLGGCPGLLGLPCSHTNPGTALGHAGGAGGCGFLNHFLWTFPDMVMELRVQSLLSTLRNVFQRCQKGHFELMASAGFLYILQRSVLNLFCETHKE